MWDYNVWLVAPDGSKLTPVTTDGDYAPPYLSPSQADDGTIAVAKGTEIVRMRQNGDTRLLTLKTNGALPALPSAVCVSSPDRKIQSPTWSPDGTAAAVGDSDGITVLRNVPSDDARCEAMQIGTIVAGGSEPDWGPADVNAQPRTGPSAPAPSPSRRPSTSAAPTLTVKSAKLKAALAKGLKVTLTGVSGTVKVSALANKTVVGRGSAKAKAGGSAVVTVRFTKSGVKRLKKLRRVTLTLRVAGGPAKVVTLRR